MTPEETASFQETMPVNEALAAPEETETQPLEEQSQPTEEVAEAPDVQQTEEVEPQADAPTVEEPEVNPFQRTQLPPVPQVAAPNVSQFIDPTTGIFDQVAFQNAQMEYQNNLQQSLAQVQQAAIQAATEEIRMERQYEKDWNKAYDVWPELKSDKKLEAMVQAIHAQSANPGQAYKSPAKAAQELKALIGGSKQEGMKAATEVRQVQAAAGLGVTNPPARVQGDRASTLKNQMMNGTTLHERQSAGSSLLEDMVRNGLL